MTTERKPSAEAIREAEGIINWYFCPSAVAQLLSNADLAKRIALALDRARDEENEACEREARSWESAHAAANAIRAVREEIHAAMRDAHHIVNWVHPNLGKGDPKVDPEARIAELEQELANERAERKRSEWAWEQECDRRGEEIAKERAAREAEQCVLRDELERHTATMQRCARLESELAARESQLATMLASTQKTVDRYESELAAARDGKESLREECVALHNALARARDESDATISSMRAVVEAAREWRAYATLVDPEYYTTNHVKLIETVKAFDALESQRTADSGAGSVSSPGSGPEREASEAGAIPAAGAGPCCPQGMDHDGPDCPNSPREAPPKGDAGGGEKCQDCDGTGSGDEPRQGWQVTHFVCRTCNGTGKILPTPGSGSAAGPCDPVQPEPGGAPLWPKLKAHHLPGIPEEASCGKQCDHESHCTLPRNHEPQDRHETEHGCVFYDEDWKSWRKRYEDARAACRRKDELLRSVLGALDLSGLDGTAVAIRNELSKGEGQ